MKYRWARNWVTGLVVLLALVACGNSEPDSQPTDAAVKSAASPASQVDVIRLAGGDWGYPTPFAHYPRGPGGFKMCLIFDSLLERDEKGLIPWLAESYRVGADGMTYSFVVRSGVHWQDNTLLTAEDVAFSFEYAGHHSATWSYVYDTIDSVAVSGQTVTVRLKKANAAMLANLGLTRIIPKRIWEKVERPKEFTTAEAVIGCGPYRLTSYSKEHGTYQFEVFAGYWGPRPRVRVIEFIPVSESILAYEKGEIDLTSVPPDLLPRFKDNPQHTIVQGPAFWGYRLLFNLDGVGWLRDLSVRQAMAYAIDRQELVDKIARGAAIPGSMGILPPGHVMAAPEVTQYPFDPERAQGLLDQAGYYRLDDTGTRLTPDGTPLTLELLCSSQEVRLAELVAQRLNAVGLRVSIRSVDGKSRDGRVRSGKYQLALLGHGGWGGDPGYLVSHLTGKALTRNAAPSSAGFSGLDDPALLSLLKRQQAEIDPVKRRKLINELQQQAAELVPEIPIYYTTGYSIYRPAKYDGWMHMFDHHSFEHGKLSYLERSGPAALRVQDGL